MITSVLFIAESLYGVLIVPEMAVMTALPIFCHLEATQLTCQILLWILVGARV